jgi:Putative MetA-pathway of phenol degradation
MSPQKLKVRTSTQAVVAFANAITCCLFFGTAAHAEEGIKTDRPDFVESSDVVGKGRFQIETSIAFERDRADGLRARVRSTPTLLRLGVSETLELRLETEGALRLRVDGAPPISGFADTALGVKWHIADGDEASGKPGMALLMHLDLDTGSRAFRGQGKRPSVRLTAEWELADDYSFGVMPGLFQERNDAGKRYVGALAAATVGIPLGETWRGFVELSARQLAAKKNGGNVFTFDAGVSRPFGSDTQIDVAFSRGINRNATDFGWTVGFSQRF